jgi:GNAT superfamily N-acetyltransferase
VSLCTSDLKGELMLTYSYDLDSSRMGEPHRLTAEQDGRAVAVLIWSRRSGLILDIHVEPEYRRRGIATALLAEARRMAGETRGVKRPRLNPQRTNDGEAFARSLGERVPPRDCDRFKS